MSQTTSPGVPMTADSTDRPVARLVDDLLRERNELRAVIEHLRATGPARDELVTVAEQRDQARADLALTEAEAVRTITSLRAALAASPAPGEGLLRLRLKAARQALIETGYFTADEVGDDIAPRIVEMHSALVDPRPAPGGDTAPREDGLREALAALCRTGVFDVSEWGERGTPYSNGAAKAFAKVAALAARPVPPGPAATRDGEAGDRG